MRLAPRRSEMGVVALNRSHIRLAAIAALACGALAGPVAADASAASCANANVRPGDASETVLAKSTVCLLNKQRGSRGMHRLRLNRRLSAAATNHSRDMVRKQYFDHTSRAGRDVVDRLTHTGYLGRATTWTVGENLAWGAGSRSTPREIVVSWMNSPGHKANILNPRFREIGIGVIFDTPSPQWTGATYTTTFGARS